MQVSVEKTSELARKMTVSVPEEKIAQQVNSKLQSLSSKVKIDGFRPGKVPHSLVRQRYGAQVRDEVLSDLIQSSFYDAVKKENLKPAGSPSIKANKLEEGDGLEYEADFEVMPEFVPMPIETLEIKRFVTDIADVDVDAMLNKLVEQRKTWSSVDRSSKDGDRVVISFEGYQGEENFTNGRTEGFPVVIGSKQMIPGFEGQLLGMAVGDKKTFELQFPEGYGNEKLSGQMARFEVEVTGVEESVLPELTADFIKTFGIEDGDLATFKADIRKNMEREMKRALKNRNKSSVMDALFDKNAIQLPESLVKEELADLIKPYHESARKRHQTIDEEAMGKQFEPMARRRVALALILGKLIDAHNVKVEPERVRAAVDDMAASYEDAEAVVRWYYAEASRLREVENMVVEDQIVDLILEKAKTTESSIGFNELMQASAGSN